MVDILVLAKAPVPGAAKTRLAPAFGPVGAARLAAAALQDTLDAVAAAPADRRVLVLAGSLAASPFDLRVPAGFVIVPQVDGDHATRIAAALAGCRGPAVLIGMDTPQVDPALLIEAAGPLRHCGPGAVDAVLGPATDGGWWALGLREPRAAAVIATVPTSRDDTGERTVHALRAAGLRVRLLPELTDVDTIADAVAVSRAAPWTRFAAAIAALPPAGESPPSGVRTTEVVRARWHRTGAA